MDPLKERLERLGQAVAEASDRTSNTERTLATVGHRLRHERVHRSSPTRTFVVLGFGLAVAAACGIGSYALWLEQSDSAITFSVEAREESTERTVQTGELETKRLLFSDGTTVSLQPASRLEVRSLTAEGATVGLSSGRARASVEKAKNAQWRFLAGPFSVKVTGTEFDLAWDPTSRVFELALHEGSVELVGPSLKAARQVRQGEFVRIAVAADEGSTETAASSSQLGSGQLGSSGASTSAAAGTPAKSAADSPGPTSAASTDARWPELLRTGNRKAAFAAVDRLGAVALDTAEGKDLWDLAHAARLGGRPQLAQQALLTLRARHGSRGQTAFLLGKVAADQLKATSEAIKWFQTYLAEDPRGPLAEQALGRLIELQAGTRAGKLAAKDYLSRYPQGAYASFARSLLR